MRTVRDIVKCKPPAFNCITPTTLVIDALNLLNSVNLSYLVVMDKGEYKGVFCERDYTRNVILKGRASNSATVAEVMTTDLPIVELNDTVEHCLCLINSYRTAYLLAFEDHRFVDVITIHDLLRQVIAGREEVFDHEFANQSPDFHKSCRIY
jgi:predicted transcriptional regulator